MTTPKAPKTDVGRPTTARAWLAANYSIPARAVAVIGVLASAWGMVIAVGDTEGENPASWLMFIGPALAGAFPTLELAWRRDHDLSMATVTSRWFVFPLFGALGAVIVMAVTEIVMRASGAMAAAQAADKWHYWFAVDGPPMPSVMFGLLGYAAGLLLAIVFFVLVLWPLQVILRPKQAIAENMMDTGESSFRRNRAALMLGPFIVIDAFVIAIAITQELGWLVVVSILAEVAMVAVAASLQRVDKQRHGEAPLPTGVELGRNDDS
ncbi:hypothetical protein O1R50_19770 [Glycomyces luteolus]|uniref:Uncharacterized protein n=1 Tax=Glycomyces luteolus TaxID=2670330 RepID=A0A9X3PCZ0_9ACTN|nr:hypothetical protein [Glycomyces luteolus]MDA1361876.1 hypothetical protein [Glycomyces luteolus]